ncbi:hypothetical protein [Salicola sp. Rm-C-2C1-2]|uniref:hypothetical protein n=1 Tax=Salicola sp. Rm-C-2C1-2 TaxID=3141321 RepID=UPI0032E385B2
MKNHTFTAFRGVLLAAALVALPFTAAADGEAGDHVKDLKSHLGNYESEVNRFVERVEKLVGRYAEQGPDAAETDDLIELWEQVRIHSAVEVNQAPVYASIWQGIYGVKEAIDQEKDIATVRAEQKALESALWQALGVVKMAAQHQADGGHDDDSTESSASGSATVDEIVAQLDEVTVEHAEGETEEATELVHDTYMNLFEGIEGALIEQDAELVESLEKDFNVTLPKLLENGASVSEVTNRVDAMKDKLARAQELLKKAEESQGDVF